MSYHSDFDPTKMWERGRNPGLPSTVPNVIELIVPAVEAPRFEPHFAQKSRSSPGEDSKAVTRVLPEIHRKFTGCTAAYVANAAP